MSDAVRGLKDKAVELTTKGKLPQALAAWQKVTEAAPDDIGARQKVAELFVKLGQKSEAVKSYEDVARRYAEMGLFFKASAMCRLILTLEPGHQRTQDLIASLYSRSKAPLPTKPVATTPPPPPAEAAAPIDIEVEVASAPPEELEIEIEVIAPPTASGLPSIPLFSMLSEAELKELLGTAMEVRAYQPGEVVVAEGASGESMFALVEGEAGVFRGWGTEQQRRVAAMGAGEIFGEVALVSRAPRVATVVTDTEAVVLEFPREAMAKVIKLHPGVGTMLEQFYRERLLANMMRASPILRSLPEASRKALSARFRPRPFTDGQLIITEGQNFGSVHMLLRGVCTATHQSGERYPDLREGDLFGEVSVLTDGPATATVTAVGPVLTLELSGEEFKTIVLKDAGAAMAVKQLARTRLLRTAHLDREHGIVAGQDIRV
jgi:cAMP-dependent protein kinase regulator